MQVSRIEQRSARKFTVLLDNGVPLVLDAKELRSSGLRENEEVSEEQYLQLMEEQRRSCLRRCGSLLKDRDYTEKRLFDKLLEAGYGEEIAESAISSLKEAGYLDDLRYAVSFAQYHIADRSRMRIRQDMIKRGLSSDVIEQAFHALEQENPEQAEEEQIRAILVRRHFRPEEATYEEKQKMRAFLYGKGYPGDLVSRMV